MTIEAIRHPPVCKTDRLFAIFGLAPRDLLLIVEPRTQIRPLHSDIVHTDALVSSMPFSLTGLMVGLLIEIIK